MKSVRRVLAVDFDGTCVDHRYPDIGKDVPGCETVLRAVAEHGTDIVLFTMRSGDTLKEAVAWFADRQIPLWGVNVNPEQHTWTASPKAYANAYVDDAAIGCPLRENPRHGGRPYVDWFAVATLLRSSGFLA